MEQVAVLKITEQVLVLAQDRDAAISRTYNWPRVFDSEVVGNGQYESGTTSVPAQLPWRKQQLVGLHAQCNRESLDVIEGNIPCLALDVRHESPVSSAV
jgi:hypothetical protein